MYFHDDKPTAEDDALTGNDNANIGATYDLTMTDEVFHMQWSISSPRWSMCTGRDLSSDRAER